MVEFFDGAGKIGEATAHPFSIHWTGGIIGNHILTANATDNGSATKISAGIMVMITNAPSCSGGPVSGDYSYRFSASKSNPALTFIPGKSGVGNPTCILYYGTSATGPFPGYNVSPNAPFTVTAAEGTRIYFYYTYSYPGEGERNTSASKHTYEIGSCSAGSAGIEDINEMPVSLFPNPVTNELTINNAGKKMPFYQFTP